MAMIILDEARDRLAERVRRPTLGEEVTITVNDRRAEGRKARGELRRLR